MPVIVQRIDRLVGPLRLDRHGPLVFVPHPAHDAESFGPRHGRFPKADPLYARVNSHPYSFAFRLLLRRHVSVLPESRALARAD